MYVIGISLLVASLIGHIGGMEYWTARQNEGASQQKKSLMKTMYDCLRAESTIPISPRDSIVTFRNCIIYKTSRCAQSSQTLHDIKQPMIIQTYCGLISGASVSSQPSTIVYSLQKNVMHFNVYTFEFEWSTVSCEEHGLSIFNSETPEIFCFSGRRIPWIMIFNVRYTAIKLETVEAYRILIFYSIHNTNWMYDFAKEIYINLKADSYLPIRSIPRISYSDAEKYHFYGKVDIMKRVLLLKQGGQKDDVSFDDGPGILSNRLWEVKKNMFFAFGFHVSFVLRHKRSQTSNLIIDLKSVHRKNAIPTCFNTHLKSPLRIF